MTLQSACRSLLPGFFSPKNSTASEIKDINFKPWNIFLRENLESENFFLVFHASFDIFAIGKFKIVQQVKLKSPFGADSNRKFSSEAISVII